MNAREPMRYAMFGAAAALFVVGGLTAGQVMGARSLQTVQSAAFQSFDYVTQQPEAPKQEEPVADNTDEQTDEVEPTATATTEPTSTPASQGNDTVSTQPQTVNPTAVPTDEGESDPPAPTTEPTKEPTAVPPTTEPTDEPTVEVTPEPEEPEEPAEEPEEPEVTPEPDPDPPTGDGPVVQLDPCILNPMAPGCDDSVTDPEFEFHPCTFTTDPCLGEEDEPIIVFPIDPCLVVECVEEPEIELMPIYTVNPALQPATQFQFHP